MFIFFPNDQVARIFPVKYDSVKPLESEDYLFALSTITGIHLVFLYLVCVIIFLKEVHQIGFHKH